MQMEVSSFPGVSRRHQLLTCVQFCRTSHSGIQWVMWRKIGNLLRVDLRSHLYSIQPPLRTPLIGCLVTWKG